MNGHETNFEQIGQAHLIQKAGRFFDDALCIVWILVGYYADSWSES